MFVEIKKKTKDAVLLLVEKERESELIDRALVKNILGIFIELGMGGMDVSAGRGPVGFGGGGMDMSAGEGGGDVKDGVHR